MEVLKSKALDNVMHREYYGLLVWNDLQADRPIDHFNSEWLKNNRGVEEDYLISVLDRVDKELSKEHASLLALVLVDFDFVYAAYYLGGYFDGFREFYKAFKYYQMCIKDERYSVKIKERFNWYKGEVK